MIRFFAAHPTAANLLMLIFLTLGIISAPQLQRATFPDFTRPEVQIQVLYPGATALEIEDAICRRIEDALDSVTDLVELQCEAQEGFAKAVAEMRDGGHFDRFVDDVRTEIDAINNFPDDVEEPVISRLGQTEPVAAIAVTGDMSPTDLKAYAEQLKIRLQRVPEVSLVEIQGFADRQLRIELNAHRLRELGLSIADIANVIQRQNLNLPAGNLETATQTILLRFADQRTAPATLANLLVLNNVDGAQVHLSDIATIHDQFEHDDNKVLFNGQRAALLQVSKTKSEDVLRVGNAMQAFIAAEQARAPHSVQLHLTQERFSIVQDRLELLLTNGWQGFILVAVTLWLFFNLRFAFWVVMGLPVSFLGTVFFMQLTGYTLNMLTMVGLLIAIGLLMDDAIVIAENIASHLKRGKNALQAAIDGSSEVMPGIVSSFLTTLCMFVPLAFLEGDIGKVLRVMPVVLIMTLAVSLVEAFLILPNHMEHALRHVHETKLGRFRRWFEAQLEWTRTNIVGGVVIICIRWRYLFIGLLLSCLLMTVSLLIGGVVKFKAFPDIDGDTIQARILLPQGTPLVRTEEVVQRINLGLAKVNVELKPNAEQCLVINEQVQYGLNADANESGAHVATISVDLLPAEQRNVAVDTVLKAWREAVGTVPDVLSINYTEPTFGPAGQPIDIRLHGDDLDRLKAASLDLQRWLRGYYGVFDLRDDLRPSKPEVRLRLREGALGLGFDATTVAQQLRAAYHGVTADEIQVGVEDYEVDVRLSSGDRNSLSDLDYFTLTNSSGDAVPLAQVAHIERGRGYGRVNRIDKRRTVSVQGNIDSTLLNVSEMLNDTEKRFLPQLAQQYPDVDVSFAGEAKEGATTQASIRSGFLLGLLGVFILLSFQFRSYIEPLIVMVAIPFALIGVIGGHWLMGLDLTMPSMVGYVSLAGIVVNDAILLVTFLKMQVRTGLNVHDAAAQASQARFRAVLLTSLTTIAGLLPLLSETSLQAQILIPLITSIVFGLLASTLLVLFVIPALYTIFEDFGWANSE